MTTPRFLVGAAPLTGASTILTGPELHHLRVRKLRVGSEVVLSNGLGQQRRGFLVALDRHQAVIRLTNDAPAQRESPLHLVLAQAILKADKLDLVIEKATELGVTELLIFTSERSGRHVSDGRQSRWNRIAQSAAKQSQRSTVPRVVGPISFEQLLSAHTHAVRLFLWEECSTGSLTALRALRAVGGAVCATVGPEGGFSAAEAQQAANAGMHMAGLAPRILRAETAAIVAVTLCQFLWGDLGGEGVAEPAVQMSPPPPSAGISKAGSGPGGP